MSERVLVTGASGFAGGHLLDLFVRDSVPVVAWHRPGGSPPRQLPGVTWQAIDLLDRTAVRAAVGRLRPTWIFHCAGAAHVARSWDNTELTFAINVRGTHHIVEGLREAGVAARLLIPGSAMV